MVARERTFFQEESTVASTSTRTQRAQDGRVHARVLTERNKGRQNGTGLAKLNLVVDHSLRLADEMRFIVYDISNRVMNNLSAEPCCIFFRHNLNYV